MSNVAIPTTLPTVLPVMALRRGVLLPGTQVPYLVGRDKSVSALKAARDGWLIVAAQREAASDPGPSDLLHTATLAKVVTRQVTGEAGVEQVTVQGVRRVNILGFTSSRPHFEATFEVLEDQWPNTAEASGIAEAFREEVRQGAAQLGGESAVQVISRMAPPDLFDAAATALGGRAEWLREILFTKDAVQRANKVLMELIRAREAAAAKKAVRERIESETRDQQRDYILRQQLKAIQEELGEGGNDEDSMERLKARLDETDLPDEVREVVDRELRRLNRINPNSPERTVAIDWLEWVADMPWGVQSALDTRLDVLEAALDRSHFGLDEVKKQVLEYLAVRKLAGSGRADVLLLLGPPGVGKTSIGQAIADSTGRKLVRVALGGVRDEAELRGHRRTYIGARPGRLVEGVRRAKTADPVILLDEIDKLGRGMQGDPASALLEILDPEQNHAFVDRYLEVPFDLSKPLFIATANDLSGIPGPLRDRMQIIEIAGYSQAEKRTIAREHLLQKVSAQAGMATEDVTLDEDALAALIDGWTKEAGVRELQRVLGKLYRAAAVKRAKGLESQLPLHVTFESLSKWLGKTRFREDPKEVVTTPGIALGLAWTPVGGTTLFVEASTLPGRGQLVLTGQLGDVMKESARAALTYTLAHHQTLGIPEDVMHRKDLHIHVPAGGTPKDGPSAGVTMFTAIASLLSGIPVRDDVAMTGEATLRGRVLPVGGIKAKILAAHQVGARRVIIPRQNEQDLADVPDEVLESIEVVLADTMDQVLEAALSARIIASAVA